MLEKKVEQITNRELMWLFERAQESLRNDLAKQEQEYIACKEFPARPRLFGFSPSYDRQERMKVLEVQIAELTVLALLAQSIRRRLLDANDDFAQQAIAFLTTGQMPKRTRKTSG